MRDTLRAHARSSIPHSNDTFSSEDASLENNTPKTEIITFQPGDVDNPRNWPRWKKWSIIGSVLLVDLSVSFGASGFSPATTKFAEDLHVSSVVATLGLSLYVAGLAWGPMTLAPLSEYFGRSPIYIASYFIYLCFLLGTALAPNLGGFLGMRFLSGFFSSVTVANFGGTIADLYPSHATGPAMSVFLWAATCGSPMGYFLFAFVAQYRGLRDVLWAIMGVCSGLWVVMMVALLVCGETRHSVLLLRKVRQERKRTGRQDIDVPEEMRRKGVKQLFKVALSRPFRFLFTEAIIIFGALYNGYLYGLSFLFNGAFSVVFGPSGHGLDTLQVGLCFLGIIVGISCGPFTNIWQEKHFQHRRMQNGQRNVPEARVQLGKVAAIVFPVSLFWFAWTTLHVHPVVPVLASAFWGWAFYTLILMTYTYTEDSYGQFSASALAGLGVVRNMAGAGFPLFGVQMFHNLGYQWAASTLAFLAIVLVPIPFVLERFGRRLRLRSPWAREHMDDLNEQEESRRF